MAAYSVAYTSPQNLLELLVDKGYSRKKIKLVSCSETVGEGDKSKVYIFMTFDALRRNMKTVFVKSNSKLCFVLCDPTIIFKYLPCIEPLDWCFSSGKRSIVVEPKDIEFNPKSKTPEFSTSETFIEALTTQVKQGSILNSIMTSVYTISNSQNQKGTTLLICKWLMCDIDCTADELLDGATKEFHISATTRERLGDVLKNPLIKVFKKVFSKLDSENTNVKELCLKYGIPPFEINYILAKCANDIDVDKRKIDELVNA